MATIFESIQAGDIEAVRAAVRDDPAAAEARDDNGTSAVRAALYVHRQDVADVLLEAGPELDAFDAAAVGDVDRLTELLDGDAGLAGAWSEDGFSPLHLAAFFGRGGAVRLLLDRGADVGAVARNAMQVQPLHSAVAAGSMEIVAALLVARADPNARQEGGFTPLMAAEKDENGDMVRLLVDHGAPWRRGIGPRPDRVGPSCPTGDQSAGSLPTVSPSRHCGQHGTKDGDVGREPARGVHLRPGTIRGPRFRRQAAPTADAAAAA